jgi:hypothetical protein
VAGAPRGRFVRAQPHDLGGSRRQRHRPARQSLLRNRPALGQRSRSLPDHPAGGGNALRMEVLALQRRQGRSRRPFAELRGRVVLR